MVSGPILVLCPNGWDRAALGEMVGVEVRFAGEELIEHPSLWGALRFDFGRYTRAIADRHRELRPAGVIGTGDYPGCLLAAAVAAELGLPGPRLERLVVLSHKLYSRELQAAHVPEATPRFEAIDPFAARPSVQLAFPFFVKPVKGTMSIRARTVIDPTDLRAALYFSIPERLRLKMLLRPFAQLLRSTGLDRVPAHAFIAEEQLAGDQVTVDGFVSNGEVVIMGIVDSIMYPGTISFRRFEYPSRLPPEVKARMAELTRRLIAGSGLDQACFNVELFYDRARDRIRIIEVNPRMSYQFSDLYSRVDGTSTFAIQLALATGAAIAWRPGLGPSPVSASFVMRRFSDARVLAVPSAEVIAHLAAEHPGIRIEVLCAPGDRLSDHFQDVGSYRYAIVNLGGASWEELYTRYQAIEASLIFRFG